MSKCQGNPNNEGICDFGLANAKKLSGVNVAEEEGVYTKQSIFFSIGGLFSVRL